MPADRVQMYHKEMEGFDSSGSVQIMESQFQICILPFRDSGYWSGQLITLSGYRLHERVKLGRGVSNLKSKMRCLWMKSKQMYG